MLLWQLGALTETGAISEVGTQIAKLPLTPTLGRVLVEAARPERDCLDEVVDIIACLSVENVFLNLVSEEKKEEAEAARRELYKREGDHLTLLATVQAYAAERSDRKAWAEKHFVSHRAMQSVMVSDLSASASCPSMYCSDLRCLQDIRKQLHAQCKLMRPQTGSTADDSAARSNSNLSESRKNNVLQCLLRGFSANVARLMADGSYKTLANHTVAIHPSSVLFGKKVEAVVFSEFVFTSRSYARGVSAVRMDWVGEVIGR